LSNCLPSIKTVPSKLVPWKCFMGEKESKILWDYGALLQAQGKIKNHTVYAINKYILTLTFSDILEWMEEEKKKKVDKEV